MSLEMHAMLDQGLSCDRGRCPGALHGCCTKHSLVCGSQAGCALSTRDGTSTVALGTVSSVSGDTLPHAAVSIVSQSCPSMGRRFTAGFFVHSSRPSVGPVPVPRKMQRS